MKTITVHELQRHLDEYLSQAQEDEVVIELKNGKRVRLSNVDTDELEEENLESDPRFAELIAERRTHYQQNGGVSFDEIQAQLIDELIDDLDNANPQTRYEAVQNLVELGEIASDQLKRRGAKRVTSATN